MIELSELFEQVKHTATPLTSHEHAAIRKIITSTDAHLEISTGTAIRIFALTHKDTEGNIEILESFLRKDADASVKSAALIGLTRYWLIKDRYDPILEEYILADDIEEDKDIDFIGVAVGLATVAIFRDDNIYLAGVIRKKLSYYLNKYVSGLKYYEKYNFKVMTSRIVMDYSYYKLSDYCYCDLSLNDSVEVSENIDDYLLGKLKEIKY